MITDAHTHVFHPKVASNVLARLAGLGFTPTGSGIVDDLLARASKAGVTRVVCHTAAMTGDQMIPANNFAVSLARREKRLPNEPEIVSFGAAHPDCPRWAEEIDKLEKAGIRGIKLHPNFQNLAFDDPRLFPMLEHVGERFFIMCHVGCEKPPASNPASPYKLAKLLSLFPKAKFIAAHLGGYADGGAAFDALAGKNLWLDTSNTKTMDLQAIRAIVAKHSRDRLLFGSDYPLFDPAEERRLQQTRLGFTDTEMERLLNNADRLFS